MKINTFVKVISALVLGLLVLRGTIYRLVFRYNEIGKRPKVEVTNRYLIQKIEEKSLYQKIDLQEIVEISDEITTKELEFAMYKTSNNPNELINTQKANCIGYSAMFNSIANYLIKKHQLQGEIRAEHKIGKLDVCGIDLHQFFESPFFKNHDFNEVTNTKTGYRISIDPSLSDYFGINQVVRNK